MPAWREKARSISRQLAGEDGERAERAKMPWSGVPMRLTPSSPPPGFQAMAPNAIVSCGSTREYKFSSLSGEFNPQRLKDRVRKLWSLDSP